MPPAQSTAIPGPILRLLPPGRPAADTPASGGLAHAGQTSGGQPLAVLPLANPPRARELPQRPPGLQPAAPAPSGLALALSPPHLAGGEMAALRATLDSGWIAPAGPTPAAFEAALAATTGFPHVLATTSGTAALHRGGSGNSDRPIVGFSA